MKKLRAILPDMLFSTAKYLNEKQKPIILRGFLSTSKQRHQHNSDYVIYTQLFTTLRNGLLYVASFLPRSVYLQIQKGKNSL